MVNNTAKANSPPNLVIHESASGIRENGCGGSTKIKVLNIMIKRGIDKGRSATCKESS